MFFFSRRGGAIHWLLQNIYVPCTREWAYAYQQGAGINTNMYVENVQVLKVVYLENKQNQRQSFERIRKLEKGKSTHRTKQIVKRHKMTKEMVDKGILPECVSTENSWRVQPQSRQQSYIVKMVMEECSCALKCTVCHACIYIYICSCADSHLHSTVCKHSHFIQLSCQRTDGLFCTAHDSWGRKIYGEEMVTNRPLRKIKGLM